MDVGAYSVAEAGLTFSAMMAFRARQGGRANLPLRMHLFVAAEVVATFGWIILFIAGFFLVPWWVPILATFAGRIGVQLLPGEFARRRGHCWFR